MQNDRQEFIERFHQEVGQRYNLSSSQVALIRGQIIGSGMDREELIEWLRTKLHPMNKRSHPKAYYERVLKFLSEINHQVWGDIIHLTHFDNHKGVYNNTSL